MTSAIESDRQPMGPFRAALFIARSQFSGCPRSVPLDDFAFGERRAMWIELENVARAEAGDELLVNDELADPTLADRRREKLIDGFITEARKRGLAESEYSRADALVELDGLDDQLRPQYARFKAVA